MKRFDIFAAIFTMAVSLTFANLIFADQYDNLHAIQHFDIDDGQDTRIWKKLPATTPPTGYGLAQLIKNYNLFTNIHGIRFDGVTTTVSGNVISLHNIRILSDTTDFDDFISIDFLMDLESLSLISVARQITPDLGIFVNAQDFFSKDVPADIFLLTENGNSLGPDQLHTINAGPNDTFTMELKAGTVITARSWDPSDDYELQIFQPNGKLRSSTLYRNGVKTVTIGLSILRDGTYTFRFVPENDPTVALRFGFNNNNRTPLRNVTSGDKISVSLAEWGHEYAKFRMQLNTGDLVEVTRSSDTDIWLYLVDANSRVIKSVIRGALFTRVPTAGTYYFFVQSRDIVNGSRYSGTVTITPDPNFSRYPVLDSITQQFANVGQPFTLQLSASNTPTRYRATGLPPTVSIDETSGLISGIPTISGTYSIRVTAENEFGRDLEDFLLTIQ